MRESNVKKQSPAPVAAPGWAIAGDGPTMADVALEAGVSPMTVSRVLNGGPASAASRNAVERAVAKLRYKPNEAARRLATSKGRKAARPAAAPVSMTSLWTPYSDFLSEFLKPRP